MSIFATFESESKHAEKFIQIRQQTNKRTVFRANSGLPLTSSKISPRSMNFQANRNRYNITSYFPFRRDVLVRSKRSQLPINDHAIVRRKYILTYLTQSNQHAHERMMSSLDSEYHDILRKHKFLKYGVRI